MLVKNLDNNIAVLQLSFYSFILPTSQLIEVHNEYTFIKTY